MKKSAVWKTKDTYSKGDDIYHHIKSPDDTFEE